MLRMKLTVALIFVVGCWPNPAFGQTQGGTIVVIFYSHDKVIFAADSRRALSNGEGVIVNKRDNECKLLALNNSVIVATAGKIVAKNSDINSENMALRFAKEAAEGIGPMEVDPAKVMAEKWLYMMVPFVAEQVRQWNTTSLETGRELTQVLFAGRLLSGALVVYFPKVVWDGHGVISGGGLVILDPSNPFLPPLAKQKSMNAFSGLVNTHVPSNFHPEWKDRDAAKALYLAEKVIDVAGDETIAKPVDVLELQANGTITWVRRKDCCRPD